MKIFSSIKLLIVTLILIIPLQIFAQSNLDDEIIFVYMTDIHIQPERNAVEGFKKAIEKVNELNPDFVITGGDLIMDALAVGYTRADSLYNLYSETIKLINAPVFNTIGNHDIWGWYEKSGVQKEHPEFGKSMYLKRLGKTYYSFVYKNIKIFILDSIEETPERGKYFGFINQEQIQWLKDELSKTDTNMVLIISSHIPLLTTFSQIRNGSMAANERGLVVENSKEVLDLFNRYNLKLVLQGHLHFYEDINIQNKIRFITGGAVSARWWTGPNEGLEEGFVLVKIKGDEIKAEYINYGWEVR